MEKIYRVGMRYNDTCSYKNGDQFMKWFNEGISTGIDNNSGMRALNYEDANPKNPILPACMILVTHEVKREGNPWNDNIDYSTGKIHYWGDAKLRDSKPRMTYLDSKGNKRTDQIWKAIQTDSLDNVPPFLHFTKPEPGVVVFSGLCVLSKLHETWFQDKGIPVKNLLLELDILDCEFVDVEWIQSRVRSGIDFIDDSKAPSAWLEYCRGNVKSISFWENRF